MESQTIPSLSNYNSLPQLIGKSSLTKWQMLCDVMKAILKGVESV